MKKHLLNYRGIPTIILSYKQSIKFLEENIKMKISGYIDKKSPDSFSLQLKDAGYEPASLSLKHC